MRKQHEKVDKYQERIDTIQEHNDLLQKQLLTEKKEKQKEQVRADIEENKKKIESIKSSKKTLERKIKKEKEDEDWTDKYRENLKKQEDEKKKQEGKPEKEEPKPEKEDKKKHPLGKEKAGDDELRDARFKNDYQRAQEDVEKFITNNQQSEENDKKLKRKLDYLNELADYFNEANWGFPGGHFGQMAPGEDEGKEEHLPEEPKQEEEEQPLYQPSGFASGQYQEENIPEPPEDDEDSIPEAEESSSGYEEEASPSDGEEETTSSDGDEEDVPQFDYSGVSKSTILVILGQLKSLIKQGDIILKKIVNNNIQSSSRDLDTITDEVTELIKLKDFLLGHLGQIKAKGQELGNYLQNILSSILGGYIENLTTYLKRYAQLNREQINGISQEPTEGGIIYREKVFYSGIKGTPVILSDAVRRINKFDKKYLL